MRRFFTLRDALTAFAVLAAAAVLFIVLGNNGSVGGVVIEVDGEEYASCDFASFEDGEIRDIEVHTDYGCVTVRIGKGYAEIIKSDCPSQSCVKTGRIEHSGQSVICLPMRVSVRILGTMPYDGMTG